jgi:hypothetical protein
MAGAKISQLATAVEKSGLKWASNISMKRPW